MKALAIAPQGQPPAPLSSQEVRGWLRAPPANQSHISLTKAKLCSLRKFQRFSELCVRNWMKTKHPCFSSRVSTGGCGQDGLIKPEIPSPQGSTKKQNASKKSQEQERNDDSGLSAPGHGTPRGWGRGPEAAWHLGTCGRSVSTAVPKPRGAEGERTAHTHRHGASGGWVPGRAGERGGNGAGPLGVTAPRPWLHAPLPTRRRPGRSDRASHAVRLALGKGGQADCVRSSWGAGPVSPSHSHRALPQAGSLTGNHSPCSEAGSRDPGRAGPSELRGSVRSRRPPPPPSLFVFTWRLHQGPKLPFARGHRSSWVRSLRGPCLS